MRSFIRNMFLNFAGNFSKPSNGIHILNGHYINKVEGNNDVEQFEELLNQLSKMFDFILFEDACNLIKSGKNLDKPYLSFSFDDGFSECFTSIAPVLERFNTNACFFINPHIIEKDETFRREFIKSHLNSKIDKTFMSWDQIIQLHVNGHIIGNHTWSHKALLNLEYNEAYEEVKRGKDELEKRLGSDCKYFAVPFGTPDFFDEVGLLAATNNHEFVFTSSFEYNKYFYKNNSRILSRRHFEGHWKISHLNYFLSQNRSI